MTHRDVIADQFQEWDFAEAGIFAHVDRLIGRLDRAGFEIVPTRPPQHPDAFVLERTEDVTGISGTGIVAEGVLFSDGTVALRWLGDWPTSVVFHDQGLDSIRHVHGHGGKTQVRWL